VHAVVLLHNSNQFLASLYFLLIDDPALKVSLLEGGSPDPSVAFFEFKVLFFLLLSKFLIDHGDSAQDQRIDSLLVFAIQLSHLVDLEL
jgi:hypothetical protein